MYYIHPLTRDNDYDDDTRTKIKKLNIGFSRRREYYPSSLYKPIHSIYIYIIRTTHIFI